jgi:hypothetical protein
MGLLSMNSLIGLTEGTKTAFNPFDKLESETFLLFSRMTTNRAAFTNLGHGPVSRRYWMRSHKMIYPH